MTTPVRAIRPGKTPPPPTSLVEATDRSRRDFLVMARRKIATEIDLGVPPHALGRLIGEMDRLDVEIRRLDELEDDEPDAADGPFDPNTV